MPNHTVPALALRPAEAARALGIGKTKLYAYVAAGELELIRLTPRTSIVPADSLRAFIDRRRGGIPALPSDPEVRS